MAMAGGPVTRGSISSALEGGKRKPKGKRKKKGGK